MRFDLKAFNGLEFYIIKVWIVKEKESSGEEFGVRDMTSKSEKIGLQSIPVKSRQLVQN